MTAKAIIENVDDPNGIVSALLETDDLPDPKSYAMKHVRLPDLGTQGRVHCGDSETPVQKYAPGQNNWHPRGGWDFTDANYDMADRGHRIYAKWYREVLQALDRGEVKGVAAGYKWKYIRDKNGEAQAARWAEQERTGNYDPVDIPGLPESIDPDEAKDIVDQLFKDGEYLGVFVTREDKSFKFLTDRFGDFEQDDPNLTPEDRAALQRLLPLGHSDQLWIAKRDGVYGIYSEMEFHDLDRPDDELGTSREAARQSWEQSHGKVPSSSAEAGEMLVKRAKEIAESVPGSIVYIYIGPDSMLGVEIRIFVPNPTPEQVKALEAAI